MQNVKQVDVFEKMKKEERKFMEESITELVKNNENVTLDQIIDYLDYLNKVRYQEREISPILEKLISEQKLIFNRGIYKNS